MHGAFFKNRAMELGFAARCDQCGIAVGTRQRSREDGAEASTSS